MKIIHESNQIDLNNITLSKPIIENNTEVIIIPLYYNKVSLLIQTPYIYNSKGVYYDSTSKKYKINITLPKNIDFFNKLDEFMIEIGKKNINDWNFDKNHQVQYKFVVDDDMVNITLAKSNKFTTLIFDENNHMLNNLLYKDKKLIADNGYYVKFILIIDSIWIKNNKYGLNIIPYQVKIKLNLNDDEVNGLTVDDLTVNDLTVDDLTVDDLTVDDLTVDDLTVDDLTVGNLTVGNLTVDDLIGNKDNDSDEYFDDRKVLETDYILSDSSSDL